MKWIDFSTMSVEDKIKSEWDFSSLKKHLSPQETADLNDSMLLTMQSSELGEGEIKWVKDHVNLSGYNPLRGKNDTDHGVRFPDMSHPYKTKKSNVDAILIRAGQDDTYPLKAPEATEIVFQTILAKHQKKTVYAIVYGPGVDAEKIINIFHGE